MAPSGVSREPLRLLFVGRHSQDADRCTASLRRAGFDVEIELAATMAAVRPKLRSGRYDLIIAVPPPPRRGAAGLVPALRRAAGRVPIIVLSPRPVGDIAAIEFLKQGATDYVVADDLARLPGAVRRALAEPADAGSGRRTDAQIRTLSVAVDQGPASVIVTDTDGIIEYVNQRFTISTGYTSDEAIGKSPKILKSGETPVAVYRDLWDTILRGEVWRGELRNRTHAGELVWHSVAISPVRDADGIIAHFVGVQQDVTDYKRAIETLDERNRRFAQLADNIREVFFIVAADFSELLYVNPAGETIWGRPLKSLYDDPRSFMDAIDPADREQLQSAIARNLQGETPAEVEFRVHRPDGTVRTVLGHSVPVLDDRGEVYRLIGTVMDITERRAAERAQFEIESMFRDLIDASFHGIVITDGGVIIEVNTGMAEIMGCTVTEMIGRQVLDFIAPESREEVAHRMGGSLEGTYDLVGQRKDGKRIQLEATARMHRLDGRQRRVTAVRDVTELRFLEEQLRRAQKMEAVGRLAGGVAHDFNNLLTVIISFAELMQEDLGPDGPNRAEVDEILKAAQGAARLTRQLLAFSRQQVLEPRVMTLEESVTSAEKLLRRVIGEDITLVTTLNAAPAQVKIDPGQLEQVIMNLAVNARDAMPEGGRLAIETAAVTLDETYARAHWPATPGTYVMLAISDTGVGMDEATQSQIFEPFFTTKEVGKGTGLGLSTVYGIVKQSGGFIWVYSEVGRGTTFKIYLPRHDGPADPAATLAEGPVPRGTETILLVEDDPAVRAVARQLLERYGYVVLEAPGAAAALRVAGSSSVTIDLLLTDVVMPGGSGPELAKGFAELQPGAKVLYMSGYTAEAAVGNGILTAGASYLQKPFSPEALARKVRAVLDAR